MGAGPVAGAGRVLPSAFSHHDTPCPPTVRLLWPSPRQGRGELPISSTQLWDPSPGCHCPAPAGSRDSPLTPFPSHPYFPT